MTVVSSDYDSPGTSGTGPVQTQTGPTSVRLSDQPWYHGAVTRIQAESSCKEEGEFLVRDSISTAGSFVLTVRWKRKGIHFQINTTMEKGKKMYHFEEEFFATIVDLISFYLTHKRPITLSSGCIISRSAVRQDSAAAGSQQKELEAAYMHVFRPGTTAMSQQRSFGQQVVLNQATLMRSISSPRPAIQRPQSTYHISSYVPPVPSSLANRPLPVPIRSPRHSEEDGDDYDEMDYDTMDTIQEAALDARNRSGSMHSLQVSALSRRFQSIPNLRSSSPMPAQKPVTTTTTTAPVISQPQKPPLPPRPSEKVLTMSRDLAAKTDATQAMKKTESDDYDDLKPKTKEIRNEEDYDELNRNSTPPSRNSLELEKRLSDGSDYDSLPANGALTPRQRDSGIYSSPSPPNEPTSCSMAHLNQLKMFLLSRKPSQISECVTYEDAKILGFLGLSEASGTGVDNGLRLILLPQGAPLRNELVNRSRNLQLAVMISIASAGKTDGPKMLRQWILAASQLMNKDGNLFGFANIMIALEHKMLRDHSELWKSLDFQSKTELQELSTLFTGLKSSTRAEPSGVLIPFLHPILEIFSSQKLSDESNFAADTDSLFHWLDLSRQWCKDADSKRATVRAQLIRCRSTADSPLGCYQIERLINSNCSTSDEYRRSLILDNIHKMLNETIVH